MKFGKILKELREAHQLKQYEVADGIGVKRTAYNNYENDIRLPNIHVFIKLADFYDISIDELVGRDFIK